MGRAPRGLFLLLAVGGWAGSGRADLFSPGPLAKPHAALEGLSNCTKCHGQGGDEAHFEEKCLACHQELAPRVAKGTGFHGRLSEEKRDCKNCHNDHQGVAYQMIEWQPSLEKFPHAEAGWPLKGKHASLKCGQCHEPRLLKAPDIVRWVEKLPAAASKTFLGLSTACANCHFDEHRGQLGANCEQCHVEKSWKPAPGFNHAKTDYPLTGKHAEVACAKCHAPQADTTTAREVFPAPVERQRFAQYKDLDHQSCTDCHQDPHRGSFGDRCESCHVTAGWSIIHNPETQRAFHDKTRYPLRGLHAEVECRACHGPFPGRPAKFKGLAFQACTDCHVDAHEGQLADAHTHRTVCEECHGVQGFLPARYELANHQKTRYPLEGAHEAIACAACHQQSQAVAASIPTVAATKLLRAERRAPLFSLAVFRYTAPLSQCETCHRDPHGGQFRTTGETLACAKCHQVSAFKNLTFDHDRDSRFPLTGKHASAACAQCHLPELPGGKSGGGGPEVRALIRYRPLEQRCASCHADVHAGQFREASGAPIGCERCHDTQAFVPAPRFVHAPPFTAYLLDGRHQNVTCNACHQEVAVGAGRSVRRYTGLPTACAGCHEDFHHGEFRQFVQ